MDPTQRRSAGDDGDGRLGDRRLTAIYSGTRAEPLIAAQQGIFLAELCPDELARAGVKRRASARAKQIITTTFRGTSPLERRRMTAQAYAATVDDRHRMRRELRRRFSLGKNRCSTCNRPKRGVPKKTWIRREHIVHGENLLRAKEPDRFRHCDCRERIEERWHKPKLSSQCMACQSVKKSALVPLRNCGHRVLCELCKLRHSHCPLCHRRFLVENDPEKERPVQMSFVNKLAEANARSRVRAAREQAEAQSVQDAIAVRDEKAVVVGALPMSVRRTILPRPTTATRERRHGKRISQRLATRLN